MRTLLVLAVGFLSSCQSAGDSAEPSQGNYAALESAESTRDEFSVAPPPPEPPPEPPPPAGAEAEVSDRAPAAAPSPAPARVLVRTAELRLRVRDYDAARDAVIREVRAAGAVLAGEAEQRLAYEVRNTFTIRVPAARLDTLLEALAGLGEEVVERRVTVDDVTEQAVDLAARLRARRAVEARYVVLLGRANTVADVVAVEAKLAEVREAIEVADGLQRSLRDRVALSTVSLTITEASPTGLTDGPGFASRLGDAVGAGWRGLLGLLVGLVALWPLALTVPLGVVAWRRLRRSVLARRRPAPPDAGGA